MAQTTSKAQKISSKDIAFNIFLYGICSLILLVIAYPLYFIIIASFSNPSEVSNGNVWFWPSQFTLDGYKITAAPWRYLDWLFKHYFIYSGGNGYWLDGQYFDGVRVVPQGFDRP